MSLRLRKSFVTRRLFLESLESRRLLDGDPGLLLGQPPTDDLTVVEIPTLYAETPEAGAIGRFASADELKDFLLADAKERYEGLFGQPAWGSWFGWREGSVNGDKLDASAPVTAVSADFSQTNVQVAGVDEADILKTDGRYLYISSGQAVTIVDTAGPDGLAMASRLELDGQPLAMYVTDGRLGVVTAQWEPFYDVMPLAEVAVWRGPMPGEPELSLQVYDVSAPAEPQLVSTFHVEGSYVDSRLIGDTLLLVSRNDFFLPAPEMLPAEGDPGDDPTTPGGVEPQSAGVRLAAPEGDLWDGSWQPQYVYETAERYFARIGDQVLALGLPNYTVSGPDGAESPAEFWTVPEQVYRPLAAMHDNLVSVAAIRLSGEAPGLVASTSAPIDWSSQLYASPENIYVVSPRWGPDGASSAIAKFAVDLSAGTIDLAATGQVPGTLLNQFALDESGDYLRVVTQDGWRNTAESNLYVLAEEGDQLQIVGRLEDLTPGEQLYSVRFLGDQAFVVTFGPASGVWYDPLLAIDLSDPVQPQLQGQLEIPGFANYLQGIDGDYLIGLGRNADESDGRPLEPQVSLYDVSDLTQPALADRVSFADAQSWSPAFYDHHAINYYPEYGVLAIPMSAELPVMLLDQPPANTVIGVADSPLPRAQSGLWLFRVTAEPDDRGASGLEVLGTIEHPDQVLRSIRIEDRLYSLSHDWLLVHQITEPAAGLDKLFLGQAAQPDWFDVEMSSQDNPLDVLVNDQLPPETGDGPVIVGVSDSTVGGAVTIAADGRSLRYTPPADFRGTDFFTYTIADWYGGRSEGQVTVGVHATELGRKMAELAQAALAQELDVPADQIAIARIAEVDWPDTSLGVPEPEQAYAQVIVPGFLVTLQHEQTWYEYHTDSQDRVVLAGKQTISTIDPVTGDPQPAGPMVRIRLEAVGADGQPVGTVAVGDSFQVLVYVQDLRDNPQGVTAAYADILFRDKLVSLDGPITFAAAYSTATAGDASSPGLLDEVGGASDGSVLDGGEHLVATIPLRAVAAGVVHFVPNPADEADHAVRVAGDDVAVPADGVVYAGTTLAVAGWQNVDDPCDVNDDGDATALDVLNVINGINEHGTRLLDRLAGVVEASAGAVDAFLDVSGDGYLSALDALTVINRLNGAIDSGASGRPLPSLASVVDWGAVQTALLSESWEAPLRGLNLTPDQVLDLAHEALVSVDLPWLQRHVPGDLDWGRFRRALVRDAGDRTVELLTQVGRRLGNVDQLAAVAAASVGRKDLPADEAVLQEMRDRLFSELGDGAAWLTRLAG